MKFSELAKERYSVRKFKAEPISEAHLNAVLEAGRVAPTACNFQPQRIYVVRDEERLQRLASVCRCTFGAPTILVIAYDRDRAWKNRLMPGYCSGETDAAIVCTHMMLEAWEQGVGSCWVGYFDSAKVGEVLELPENVCVTAMLPMGYPAEDAAPLELHGIIRPIEETVTFL